MKGNSITRKWHDEDEDDEDDDDDGDDDDDDGDDCGASWLSSWTNI